ncbi:hypothetical protein [Bartonella saheliensis]|uniref:hypothetical protein n=1 Tax=Bartonella saheliensis TaxID=1457016 RepID=UPI0011A34B4C|nr:hypothetical protein [Bartonella saheliensis]
MSSNEMIMIVCALMGILLFSGVMFRFALHYREKSKQLVRQIAKLQIQISNLKEEIEEKEIKFLKETKQTIDECDADLKELNQKIDEYDDTFKRKNEIINSLTADVQSRGEEIERLKQEITKLKDNIVPVDPTKKYEFTGEIKEYQLNSKKDDCTHILHRIRALRSFGNVKKGDLGGWIAKEANLSHEGDCWIGGEAMVFSDAQVYSNAQVYDKAQAYGRVVVGGNAKVYGNACVYGNAEIWGAAQVYEEARVYGYATVTKNAEVYGKAQVYEEALIYGTAKIYDNATVCGNARVDTRNVGGGTLINSGEVSTDNKNSSSQKKSK